MTWQLPTKNRPQLLKTVRTFFLSQGWTINEIPKEPRGDYIAVNREMTYLLSVVDGGQREFFRFERMVDGMLHDAREIRSLKQLTLVYILNFRFPSLPFETLVEQGASAFALEEMSMVTSTAAYQDEPPPELGIREMALLEGNAKTCLRISNQFHEAGNHALAIKWAEHAIKLRNGVSAAHLRLFRLYLGEGDLDSAERIGQEVFSFQPKNAEFLKLMEKLAIQRNDPEAAAIYRARRAPERLGDIAPRSFEALIQKQKTQRAAEGHLVGASLSTDVEPKKTMIGRLFGRLTGEDK